MEGNVIRTIRTNRDYIAHFHTGGVPGRHELDGTQELNWHAIAAAIADTGFQGFVEHEFTPTSDPLTSLSESVAAFTVCEEDARMTVVRQENHYVVCCVDS